MKLYTRAVISILAGIGSGLVGFYAVWRAVELTTESYPGEYTPWLLTGIFLPFVAVTIAVFRTVSRGLSSRPSDATLTA
jgi:hypothetical protein